MTSVFAESYYYLALLNPRDEAHLVVRAYTALLTRPIVTTAWIMAEVADALASPTHRRLFGTLVDELQHDPDVELLPASQTSFDRGCDLYRSRLDKNWSLTDSISFATMQSLGISDALTADRHFEQAGFVALLK